MSRQQKNRLENLCRSLNITLEEWFEMALSMTEMDMYEQNQSRLLADHEVSPGVNVWVWNEDIGGFQKKKDWGY